MGFTAIVLRPPDQRDNLILDQSTKFHYCQELHWGKPEHPTAFIAREIYEPSPPLIASLLQRRQRHLHGLGLLVVFKFSIGWRCPGSILIAVRADDLEPDLIWNYLIWNQAIDTRKDQMEQGISASMVPWCWQLWCGNGDPPSSGTAEGLKKTLCRILGFDNTLLACTWPCTRKQWREMDCKRLKTTLTMHDRNKLSILQLCAGMWTTQGFT